MIIFNDPKRIPEDYGIQDSHWGYYALFLLMKFSRVLPCGWAANAEHFYSRNGNLSRTSEIQRKPTESTLFTIRGIGCGRGNWSGRFNPVCSVPVYLCSYRLRLHGMASSRMEPMGRFWIVHCFIYRGAGRFVFWSAGWFVLINHLQTDEPTETT